MHPFGRISIITISYSKSFLFLLHTTSPYFRVPQLYTKPWNGKPQQLWNQPKGGYNVNPEKPDVPLNKNDAFQKVQKRHVQEKR